MVIMPIPNVRVLTALKQRYRLGVISNTVGSGDTELTEALDKAGIRPLIDALVTSRDFGRPNPIPPSTPKVPPLGVPLDETVMSATGWTRTSRAVECRHSRDLLRHPGDRDPGDRPSHIIDGLAELPAWLDATYVPDRR